MAFSDFTGTNQTKTWKILAPSTALCKEGEIFAIRGTESDVTIECGGTSHSNLYSSGEYNAAEDKITAKPPCGYTLRIVDSQLQCTSSPGTPYGMVTYPTGSWTAEDQGPDSGSLNRVTRVKIRSTEFSNVYLRMDGTNVVSHGASGKVNCQFGTGQCEELDLVDQGDGTFAIASVYFPGVYLRMDGQLNQVNCQSYAGAYEKFQIIRHCDGKYVIASNFFPHRYLRMDGTGVTAWNDKGGGAVNCQTSAGVCEKFDIL